MVNHLRSLANYWLRYGFLFDRRVRKVIALRELDNNRLLEIQNERFLAIFRQAIKHSKFYRQLYGQHGITLESIRSISDIDKLPAISKEDIRHQAEDLFIGNKLGRIKSFTSGTSGSPLMTYRTYDDILEESAYLWSHRFKFGYKPGMKTVSLRGDLGRNEMEQYDKFTNTLFLSSYNIKEENADWYYKKITDFAPYALLSYPSSVANLANLFLSENKVLHVPCTFTSSETLYENQRVKAEEAFNTKIYDWYGNAERSIAIEQRENGKYYELPTYSYNEYFEDHTVTTGFINHKFPLIRYIVNDVIKKVDYDSDAADSRFEISEIYGRNDDMLLLPDGTKVGRLSVALKYANHVELAQFVQAAPEKFTLNLVVTDQFSPQDEQDLRKVIDYRVGNGLEYDVRQVTKEEIIKSKSGKFKLVVNKLLT